MDFFTTGDDSDELLASTKLRGRNVAPGGLTSLFTSGEGVVTGNEKEQSSDFKYRAPKKNSTLPQDGKNDYKSLGKAGLTIIDKGRVGQESKNVTSSVDFSSQKILVLYRSKQEALVTLPITCDNFSFNIQNDKYGYFYTTGGNQQKLTWSLCFRDQEALSEFSRMVALSRLAASNVHSNPSQQFDTVPIITQNLKKYQHPQQQPTSTKNEFVQPEDIFARFSINGWIINSKEFVYDTHFIINKTQEVVKGLDMKEQPAWSKYMIGIKVNEIRLIIVPNDGTFCDNNISTGINKDISNFIALEISLLERHELDSPTKQMKYTKSEEKLKETNDIDDKTKRIENMLPMVGQYLFAPVNSGAIKQTQSIAAINSIQSSKRLQATQTKIAAEQNEYDVKTVEESTKPEATVLQGDVKQRNIATCSSPSWVDLILTEQRIQHLAILRIDEKMNRMVSTSNDLKTDVPTEIIQQVGFEENVGANVLRLQEELRLSHKKEAKLKAQLEEAHSKFERIETLLHSTEAELVAVKEDVVNLTNTNTNIIAPPNNKEDQIMETNKMLKKILGKIFKQTRTTFTTEDVEEIQNEEENSASTTTSSKAYSGEEVVQVLAQHFRDAIEYLNLRNNTDKENQFASDVNQN